MKQIDAKTGQLLSAYLDDELSDEARQKLETRLANEPLLATALQEEQQLRIRLRSHVRRHRAPTSLRNRVKQALSSSTAPPINQIPTSADQPQTWWQRLRGWWQTPLRVQPAYLFSYTLFWLIILSSVLYSTRPALGQVASEAPPVENHSVFRQLAGKHGVYFTLDEPLDIRGTPEQIYQWFQKRVPYPISIPTLDGWKLEGARLGEFHHQGTVHLLYRRADQPFDRLRAPQLSLTLFLPRDSDFPSNSSLETENQTFFIGDDGKRHAILWRHNETGYALVADFTLTEEELLPIAANASQQLP